MRNNTDLDFNEETHTYTDKETGKEVISVTQLMAEQGLAPEYSYVDQEYLRQCGERGKLIHKEIEEFIETGKIGFTKECLTFVENFESLLHRFGADKAESEVVLYDGRRFAGTADLILKKDGKVVAIGDIKTTYTLHEDAVAWQLSFYAEAVRRMHLVFDGDKYKSLRLFAIHFTEDEMRTVPIEEKPLNAVDNVWGSYVMGFKYSRELFGIDEGALRALSEAEKVIAQHEALKKELVKKEQQIRSAIMAAMEKQGIKTFQNDFMRITYVGESERTSVDVTALRKDHPDIAKEYEKKSVVKPSLKITLKGNK